MNTEWTPNNAAEVIYREGARWIVTKLAGHMVASRHPRTGLVFMDAEYSVYIRTDEGWRFYGCYTLDDARWMVNRWTPREALAETVTAPTEAAAPETRAETSALDVNSPSYAKAVTYIVKKALEYTADGDLLITSDTRSGVRYSVNEHTCQCEAHKYGRPCWHRVAYQLAPMQGAIRKQVEAAAAKNTAW